MKDMVAQVRHVLDSDWHAHGVCPLVLGGDHAITYPLVLAHLAERPQLGLLHLDAHNDVFYTPQIVYSHAAPISNLLKRSSIERIVSCGLRTFSDKRVGTLEFLYRVSETSQRISLYTLTTLKQLLMNPAGLEFRVSALGRPPLLSHARSGCAVGGRDRAPAHHAVRRRPRVERTVLFSRYGVPDALDRRLRRRRIQQHTGRQSQPELPIS